jgi:hypothetical protein
VERQVYRDLQVRTLYGRRLHLCRELPKKAGTPVAAGARSDQTAVGWGGSDTL